MTVSELTARLDLPEQTLQALQMVPMPGNASALKDSFFHQTDLFSGFAEADPTGLTVLKLYLHWASETRDRYERLGIPEDYFWDSMQDLPIWAWDHLEKHGSPGFATWPWVGRSLCLEVIRIGRLQFEAAQLPHEAVLDGTVYPAGTPVLGVHIPAGRSLDPDAVQDSLDRAPEFFRTYFGLSFRLMHCHSWLLSPALRELLPAHSRILRFQDRFRVYRTDNEERQAESRVFGFCSDDPREYPENTSLQKAVKQYLLNGKEVLMGHGIRAV